MELYIDKENLKSFLKSRDDDDFQDCFRMLKRQLHVVYNMDKAELRNEPVLSQWINLLNDGRGCSELKDTFLSSLFPIRPIKSNSPRDWDRRKLSSVYLLDDPDCVKLKNKGCVLLGEKGEEIPILLRLFCGKDYDYHHLYDLQKNFDCWERLIIDNQMLPCTDIIVNDRYIFSNDFALVEYNLKGLLLALTLNVKNRINIVFFTKNDALQKFGEQNAHKIIENTIFAQTGVKPNITFVTSNDSAKILHDRFIITNYRLIRSGDSFLYFNTQGKKITNGGSLDIDSMANYETHVFVDSLLEKLQSTIDKHPNKDMIIGTKESKFLKFE